MRIRRISPAGDHLLVTWQDDTTTQYDYFWLRDNARDAESFNAASFQRELFTAGVSPDIQPIKSELTEEGRQLLIQWPGMNVPVSYCSDFLFECSEPASEYVYHNAQSWTADSLPLDAPLSFSTLHEEPAKRELVSRLQRVGVCILDQCPTDVASVQTVADLLGYVRETIFGGIWQFEDNQEMADSAFTSGELRPHHDGTYSHDAPGLQLLLCMRREATGGESVLVDGFAVAEQLKAQNQALYNDMTWIELTGIYKGDGHVLKSSRPVFRENAQGQLVQMSFNNYDRETVCLPNDVMRRAYEGIVAIDKLLNEPGNQWRFVLKEGQMMVFDNWRLLHGRSSYQGQRKMAGTYVNREDFESRLRSFDLM